jgi:hypothetical protein
MENQNLAKIDATAEPGPELSGRRPEDCIYDAAHTEERGRMAQAHEIKSGLGGFIPREFIEGRTGPAIIHIENGKIRSIKNKPSIDRGSIKEILEIIKAAPIREEKNKALKIKIDDYLKNYKYESAQSTGGILKAGENELERLRLMLPDRLSKFPGRWAAEVQKMKAFRDELVGIIDEINAEIIEAEKTAKEFLAAHSTDSKPATKK